MAAEQQLGSWVLLQGCGPMCEHRRAPTGSCTHVGKGGCEHTPGVLGAGGCVGCNNRLLGPVLAPGTAEEAWASTVGSTCDPGVVAPPKDTLLLLSSTCLKQGTSHFGKARVSPLAGGEASHNPAPRDLLTGMQSGVAPGAPQLSSSCSKPSSPCVLSPWGASRACSGLPNHSVPACGGTARPNPHRASLA